MIRWMTYAGVLIVSLGLIFWIPANATAETTRAKDRSNPLSAVVKAAKSIEKKVEEGEEPTEEMTEEEDEEAAEEYKKKMPRRLVPDEEDTSAGWLSSKDAGWMGTNKALGESKE